MRLKSNLSSVIRQVNKVPKDVDKGVQRAANEMGNKLLQLAKEEIKGRRPKGQKATPGQPPMNRTGKLRGSIKMQVEREGFATYKAEVGPTLIYGRSLEVAGKYAPPTWSGAAAMEGFPYMLPAFKKFQPMAMAILRKHLAIWSR